MLSSLWWPLWTALMVTLVRGFGPPRLRMPGNDLRQVVTVGSEVIIACPVRADPSTLFLEWFRGREPLTGVRKYRLTPQGALRVRKVTLDDAGLYTCRAVNGFGSIEVHVTLVVIAQRERFQLANATSDQLGSPPSSLPGAAPLLTMLTPFNGSVVQRSAGATVKLKCAGTGEPTPLVTWLRNGQPLNPANGSSVKQQRWSLQIENLKTSDAGNYTCVLRNSLGTAAASYLLEVVDGNKPEVTGSHPLNTTVEFGSTATFQCRVRSEIPPHIRWLKRVDPGEREENQGTGTSKSGGKQRIIRVQGEMFRFLKSSQVVSRPDGSFLNKLVIREAREEDSGKYICLGANSLGYSYRSAHLSVLRRHHSTGLMDWERAVILRPGQPDALMIGIPVTVGVIVGVVVTLAILCHSRTRAGSASGSGGGPSPGGEPVILRSVEQQTSFSSFPPFPTSSSRSDSPDQRFAGAVFLPDPRAFHHSELVYQERSVVTRLHECPAKDQYDCFFLRDNV